MMARLSGVRFVACDVPCAPRYVYALKAKLVYTRNLPGGFGAGLAMVTGASTGGGSSAARALPTSRQHNRIVLMVSSVIKRWRARGSACAVRESWRAGSTTT